MADIILDFEKPIEQMAARQAELEDALSSNPELAGELKTLKKLIHETKAAIYSKLTPWQRVQLARHPNRPYTLHKGGSLSYERWSRHQLFRHTPSTSK